MFHFILVSLLAHATNAWVLEPSDRQLYAGMATNVSLHCYHRNDDNGQSRMKEVLKISLNKLQDSGLTIKIAHVHFSHDRSDVKIDSNLRITAIGHAENVDNSFLTVTWSDAFPDALGNYSCTVNGIDAADAVVIVTTDPVTLSEMQCAAKDLLARTMALENQYKRREKSILDALGQIQTIIELTHRDLDGIRKETESELKNMTDEVGRLCQMGCVGNNTKTTTNETRTTPDETEEALEWPEGDYYLHRAKYGCPITNVTRWTEQTSKFHLIKHALNDASVPNHFAQPMFTEDGQIYNFHYCHHEIGSSKLAWPKGTFCVAYSNKCPPGFYPGSVTIPLKTDVTHNFCCRQDGVHDKPITLPVRKPFYLYRYGGKCQQVKNAVVSQEWITVHTGRGTSKGSFSNTYHVDATLNPYHYYLCYYQRRE